MPLLPEPDLDAPAVEVAVLAAAEEESAVGSRPHRPLMSKLGSVQQFPGLVEQNEHTCVDELAKPQLCSFMSPETQVAAAVEAPAVQAA
jgi:hypothetical protein